MSDYPVVGLEAEPCPICGSDCTSTTCTQCGSVIRECELQSWESGICANCTAQNFRRNGGGNNNSIDAHIARCESAARLLNDVQITLRPSVDFLESVKGSYEVAGKVRTHLNKQVEMLREMKRRTLT